MGLPFPSPGDLPDPSMEPESPALHTNSEPPGREKKSSPLISPIGDRCCAVQSCSRRPSMQTRGTAGWSHLFRVSRKRERRAIPSGYIWHYMKATRRKEEGKYKIVKSGMSGNRFIEFFSILTYCCNQLLLFSQLKLTQGSFREFRALQQRFRSIW